MDKQDIKNDFDDLVDMKGDMQSLVGALLGLHAKYRDRSAGYDLHDAMTHANLVIDDLRLVIGKLEGMTNE